MGWFSTPIDRLTRNLRDEQVFESVAREIMVNEIRPGLWAKAFVEAGGDEQQARAKYTKLRAEQIRLGIDVSEQMLRSLIKEIEAADSPKKSIEPPALPMPAKANSWGLVCIFCQGQDIELPDLSSGRQAYCNPCQRYLKWGVETGGNQSSMKCCPNCGSPNLGVQGPKKRWCRRCGQKDIP